MPSSSMPALAPLSSFPLRGSKSCPSVPPTPTPHSMLQHSSNLGMDSVEGRKKNEERRLREETPLSFFVCVDPAMEPGSVPYTASSVAPTIGAPPFLHTTNALSSPHAVASSGSARSTHLLGTPNQTLLVLDPTHSIPFQPTIQTHANIFTVDQKSI
jgi:hypothetical protein